MLEQLTVKQRLKNFKILKDSTRSILFDRETMLLRALKPELADDLDSLMANLDLLPPESAAITKISNIINYLTAVRINAPSESQVAKTENETPTTELDEKLSHLPSHRVLPKLAINIANACNLACTYCYANKGVYGTPEKFLMKPELIEATIEKFAERFDYIEKIQFMGGEPSMNPSAIKQTALVFQRLVDEGKLVAPASLGMVSNGLNYSDEFWDVLQKYNCQVTVSLDGPAEIHDTARVLANGAGSYQKIHQNIRKALDLGIQIGFEPTFSRAHLNHGMTLIDLCQWFFDEYGHRCLHAPAMSANPYERDSTHDLGLTNEEKIREYCSVSEWGLDNLFQGHFLMHGFTQRILHSFETRIRNSSSCPAGTSQLAVSTKGDVSPCWMFTDEKPFYMGNVKKNDFLGPKAAAVLQAMGEYDLTTHPECRKCWIQPVCFGCRGGDYHATETINGKTDCDYMRAMVETIVLKVCEAF